MDEKYDYWYINIKIQQYTTIDDVVQIINLLDNAICGEEKIYQSNTIIKISKSTNYEYDYICTTDELCNKETIIKYLNSKFEYIQKFIKSSYEKYGFDWFVSWTIE